MLQNKINNLIMKNKDWPDDIRSTRKIMAEKVSRICLYPHGNHTIIDQGVDIPEDNKDDNKTSKLTKKKQQQIIKQTNNSLLFLLII